MFRHTCCGADLHKVIPLMHREDVASSCGINHLVGTGVAGVLVSKLDNESKKRETSIQGGDVRWKNLRV